MFIASNSVFVAWIAVFLDDASKSVGRHRRELIEQLDRASLSMLLNTAEGNAPLASMQRSLKDWFPPIVFVPASKCSHALLQC
jgi:hypothetical protein